MIRRFLEKMQSDQGRNDLKYAIARSLVNPVISRAGLCLLTDHFYQPIPSRATVLQNEHSKRMNSAINWRVDQQFEYLTRIFSQFANEFNDPSIFNFFDYSEADSGVKVGDSQVLYAMIRDNRPKKIIEIGSGGSSQVMMAALRKNYLDTKKGSTFLSIDPFTSQKVKDLSIKSDEFAVNFEVINSDVQSVDLSVFESLESGDILFVDSSHVYKSGSDVEFEFMNVYPRLKPGVLVHIHDIFFPFDYPVEWFTKYSRFWNEQYILEAFLQFNKNFEIVAALSLMASIDAEVFNRNIKDYRLSATPGSFWMRAMS